MTSAAPLTDDTASPPPQDVGIDAEQVARFDKLAAGEKPWRLVYSPREAVHLAAQPHAARAFCAAFCCKEAFYKALGAHYAFPELECLYRGDAVEQEVLPTPALQERQALARVCVRFDERFVAERGELLVEVRIRRGPAPPGGTAVAASVAAAAGRPGTRIESVAVAAVEADRRRVEEQDFSPEEIADLGRRRVQSLAGFLALKRALAGLCIEAGAASAQPRDFVLGHRANGAPRLLDDPAGLVPGKVLVSVSHTRRWAYALAALGGQEAGR